MKHLSHTEGFKAGLNTLHAARRAEFILPGRHLPIGQNKIHSLCPLRLCGESKTNG